jgi:two-component system cell cycle sensor histidine kinase/response regulator CckA
MTDHRPNSDETSGSGTDRHHLLRESEHISVVMVDLDGRFLDISRSAARRLGGEPADIIGRTLYDTFGPDAARHLERFRKIADTGRGMSAEDLFEMPHGSRWFSSRLEPLFDEQGNVNAIQIVSFDMTELAQAREDVAAGEQRYRQLVENMEELVYRYEFHPERRFAYVSPAAERMTGYSPQEHYADPELGFKLVHPDDRELLAGLAHADAAPTSPVVIRWLRRDGSVVWTEQRTRYIHDDTGRLVAVEGVVMDVTERKLAEQERERLEAQLRRAQKLETIGTLAGGIAHDFNNILAPIVGYTDMVMQDLGTDHPLHRDLQHVLRGAERARDLVEQILLFSRQAEKERQPLVMSALLGEALKLLRPSIPATVQIVTSFDPACGRVWADATQIHQVVVNLCANAWQSMGAAGGTLTIELAPDHVDAAAAARPDNLAEGDYVRLTVRDTGGGMDAETAEQVFEPFFTTRAAEGGTGLGLSVVHGIVRGHGGDIELDTTPGAGSTFHVRLPVVRSDAVRAADEEGRDGKGSETLLVADDEEVVVDMVRRMLTGAGYLVDAFSDPRQALAAFERDPGRYDLLLTDLTMPDLTGLDLADAVRRRRADLPVVVMTGFAGAVTPELARNRGVARILAKPLTVRQLSLAVREALDGVAGP